MGTGAMRQAGMPLAGTLLALAAPLSSVGAEEAGAREPVNEVIIVLAQQQRGGIEGAPAPLEVLDEAAIEAAGAATLEELLASITPQARSGRSRGSGAPAVLLNGRRIAGFGEIRLLPSEAIARVDVLPEEVAVRFGFAPDQRVVNFVLKENFRAITADLDIGTIADGAATSREFDFSFISIAPSGRVNFSSEIGRNGAVTEADRGIVDPTGQRDTALRTVSPESTNYEAGLTLNRTLGKETGLTIDLRGEGLDAESRLGASAGRLLSQVSQSQTWRSAATLDGFRGDWQWTASLAYDHATRDVRTDQAVGLAATAQTQTGVVEAIANANGPLADLPAGPLRAALRIGVEDRKIEARSQSGALVSLSDLARTEVLSRASLTVPITSRRYDFGEDFGEWSLTANASYTDLSDFDALFGYGAALTFSPLEDLRFTLSQDRAEAAPSIQQLGEALVATPNVEVFDVVRGESVAITRLAGGNPGLSSEQRTDLSLGAVYEVEALDGLELQATYARFEAEDVLSPFPTLTPALEQAFPARFTRDASGRLTALDRRAINIAERQTEQIRWGFSFARNIGKPEGRGGAGPVGPRPAGGPPSPAGAGARSGPGPSSGPGAGTSRPGGGPPPGVGGGGGGFGAMMGGPGGAPGRWSVSVFHTWKLDDAARFTQDGPLLNLLDGDALSESGSAATHAVELEGGWFYRGLGFRLSANWQGESRIDSATPGASLAFDPILTANLRAFVNFSARPKWVEAYPFLKGARFFVRIDNLTNSAQNVTNAGGLVPFAFQEGFQSPRGRVIELDFRKQF